MCRRGSKYPERVLNSTKVSYSVMFCGNAAGTAVPPYIIYKSEHLWTTWTEDGPDGARYNRTKSGWMDSVTFEDWFIRHLLPILKRQEGRKVVIGDNLSSHISKNVLLECEKHNISFICLLPNATHILQPLDVAYFRPLKIKWREELMAWKESQQGRKLPSTPKELFPSLLKKALNKLTDTPTNLISGFRRSGIYPPNVEEPLKRLPKQDRIVNIELIGDVFLQKLDQARNSKVATATKPIKKKKIDVPAGRSICAKDVLEAGPSGCQSKSQKIPQPKTTNKVLKKKPVLFEDSTTDCSDADISLASSTEDLIMACEVPEDSEDGMPLATLMMKEDNVMGDSPVLKLLTPDLQSLDAGDEDIGNAQYCHKAEKAVADLPLPKLSTPDAQVCDYSNKPSTSSSLINLPTLNDYLIGDHVIVLWNSVKYPGIIISESEEGAMVSCMKKIKGFWRWPAIKDEQLYRWEDVIKKIGIPKFIKKGCFAVSELVDSS
jgi:hypothetical protein